MINIICNAAECYIENNVTANLLDKNIYTEIENKLSYVDKNKAYIKMSNRDARWSDNIQTSISLYNKEERNFPSGLLDLVVKVLKYYTVSYKITDNVTYSLEKVSKDIVIPEWAYSHQFELIDACIKGKRGILMSPTGSGKSKTLAWLLHQFKNVKGLIVVPRVNLCQQLYEELKETLPQFNIGQLNNEYKTFDIDTDILVAVDKSAAMLVKSNPTVFNDINFLAYDEAQKALNETFKTILYSCVNAEYKLGFSATPVISLLSKAYFGDLQLKIQENRLIDEKIIVEPTFISYKVVTPNFKYPFIESKQDEQVLYVDDNGRPTFNNKPPYISVYTQAVALNKLRNQTIVDISKYLLDLPSRKGPIIVFIEWQDIHGTELVEVYKQNNINITFLNGLTSNKERERIIKDLREERIDIVLATNVVAEGTNIVNLEFAIIADGKKTGGALIQKVGRIVRTDDANNKTRCVAIDISDTDKFYLSNAANSRQEAFKERYGDKKIYTATNLIELNTVLKSI